MGQEARLSEDGSIHSVNGTPLYSVLAAVHYGTIMSLYQKHETRLRYEGRPHLKAS